MTSREHTIPKGWQKKQIKDLLDYERPDKYIVENDRYGVKGTPVLTANKSFILGYTDETNGIYDAVPAIIFDDFTTDSKFVEFPFKIKSSAIKILKGKTPDVDLRFVYEKMKSINFPTGSHKRYYISQYQNMEVELPPIAEQQKIADMLKTVDEAINKTEEILLKAEDLKRGVMERLLTEGINHTEFKQSAIGKVPKDWLVTKLGEIATITRGGSPRPIEDFITTDEDGLNWLKIGDIESGAKYITRTSQKIKKSGLSKTTQVHQGDFILSNSMSFGRPYIMKIDACIHDGWLAFKEIKDDLVTSEFLYYLLSSKILQSAYWSIAAGSGVKNLKRESVSNVVVALPPVIEQQKIAEILSVADEKVWVNRAIKEKLTLLKKGLMDDLLSGKKRTV